jgi:hypothetical protein
MTPTSVKRDDRTAGLRGVELRFADEDRGIAEEDAETLRALGLKVTMAPLDAPLLDSPTPQLLVYLSRHNGGSGAARELLALVRSRGTRPDAAGPVEPVFIDVDGSDPPVELTAPPLARHALTVEGYRRALRATVLETLDQTGWAADTSTADQTRFVPASLIVSWADQSFVIPPDFRGLVTIGRSASCQIHLDSTFASRLHGCFRYDHEHYHYRDMSTNGTVLYDGHEELLLHDEERLLPEHGELKIGDVGVVFSIHAP